MLIAGGAADWQAGVVAGRRVGGGGGGGGGGCCWEGAHGLAPRCEKRGVAEGNQHHLITHAFCASLSSL